MWRTTNWRRCWSRTAPAPPPTSPSAIIGRSSITTAPTSMRFRSVCCRMRFRTERWLALSIGLLLAGCGGGGGIHRLVQDTPVKIGRPYTVNGRTYVPTDVPNYDQIGEASWYGTAEQGRHTASGEIFYRQRPSAAHTTLPLPSYVEVTRLDTGQRILVRVNDRGPYARDRILDLSQE